MFFDFNKKIADELFRLFIILIIICIKTNKMKRNQYKEK